MTTAEAEMLRMNGIGLEGVDFRKKYRDKSVQEVLENEFGAVGRFIELDETMCIEDIRSQVHK